MDENKLLAMVITREQKGKRGGRTNMEPFIYYLSNYASKLQVCITFTKKKTFGNNTIQMKNYFLNEADRSEGLTLEKR